VREVKAVKNIAQDFQQPQGEALLVMVVAMVATTPAVNLNLAGLGLAVILVMAVMVAQTPHLV
jgi:hypothetical protein